MKSTYLITVPAVVSWVGCATAPPDNSAAFQHGLTDIFANATQEQPYKIAVLPLVDFRSETQDALSSYLSSDVIFEITRSFPDRFTILERDLIESILTEFEFSLMSGMISEEEVAQFGRMSGADYLIIGTKLELTETIQVNLRLVDVESAEIIGVARIDLAMEEKYATLIDGTAVASGASVDEQPTTPSVGGPDESGGAPDDLPGLAFNEGELVAEFSFEEWPVGLDYGDGVRVHEGMIHARAPVGAGTGWMIPATISEPGVVSFDLRLGEMINEDHPPIHVNLYRDESQRVCLMFGSEFLISFQNFDGRSENGHEYELTLPVGNWAHIDLVLEDGYVSAYVNGAAVGTIEITDEITRSGNLLFECHNEFWIDNLAIRRVDAIDS